MPRKSDCDHVVRTAGQFVNSVTEDHVSIYVEDNATIDLSKHVRRNGGIDMGSGVTIVSGYCDPEVPGRGGEIVCKANGHRVLTSCYGEAPSLWGVSMRGPRLEFSDPDHLADDFPDKQSTGLHCYDTKGTLEVVGCEFRGWTMAGLEVGAKNYKTTAEIRRTSMHHNQMNHLGYGVQLYSGDLSMDRCFLNKCRHGISGFGYPSCSWSLENSVVGPDGCGHPLDMHKLSNNIDSEAVLEQFEHGGDTAGGDILIRRCSLMLTWDIRGFDQEIFALRGIPTGEAHIEKSQFWHESKPTTPNVQGNAYRQEWDSWKDFYVENNVFGPEQLTDGIGAPRAKKGHEDDDEPEEDDPSGTPSEPPMKRLKISGHGGTGVQGDYSVVVHGDVETTDQNEPSEQIEDLDGERTKITGNMWGGVDEFDLADDALPVSAESKDVPLSIYLDGDDITGGLTAVESAQRFADLQAQIDELREWAKSLSSAIRGPWGDSE